MDLPVWVCGSEVYSGLINGNVKSVSSFMVYLFQKRSTCLLLLSPLLSWMMHNFGPAYTTIKPGTHWFLSFVYTVSPTTKYWVCIYIYHLTRKRN